MLLGFILRQCCTGQKVDSFSSNLQERKVATNPFLFKDNVTGTEKATYNACHGNGIISKILPSKISTGKHTFNYFTATMKSTVPDHFIPGRHSVFLSYYLFNILLVHLLPYVQLEFSHASISLTIVLNLSLSPSMPVWSIFNCIRYTYIVDMVSYFSFGPTLSIV